MFDRLCELDLKNGILHFLYISVPPTIELASLKNRKLQSSYQHPLQLIMIGNVNAEVQVVTVTPCNEPDSHPNRVSIPSLKIGLCRKVVSLMWQLINIVAKKRYIP